MIRGLGEIVPYKKAIYFHHSEKNLCLLKQQESIHTNLQTEKHKKLALGRNILDGTQPKKLPIFQGDKSCVFQQDSTQPHNFRSINLLLE